MKEIIFSQGGMPIALDDFVVLQDNASNTLAEFIEAITNTDVFFLRKPSVKLVVNSEDNGNNIHYVVGSGAIWYKQRIVKWEETDVKVVGKGQQLYICMKKEESDKRVFEDSQTRPTRQEFIASVSTNPQGSIYSVKFNELKTFISLLKDAINDSENKEWTPIEVEKWYNGYSGEFYYKETAAKRVMFRIKFSSNKNEWDNEHKKEVCVLSTDFVAYGVIPPYYYIPINYTENKDNDDDVLLKIQGQRVSLSFSNDLNNAIPSNLSVELNNKLVAW